LAAYQRAFPSANAAINRKHQLGGLLSYRDAYSWKYSCLWSLDVVVSLARLKRLLVLGPHLPEGFSSLRGGGSGDDFTSLAGVAKRYPFFDGFFDVPGRCFLSPSYYLRAEIETVRLAFSLL
jgi:hypothetical protein